MLARPTLGTDNAMMLKKYAQTNSSLNLTILLLYSAPRGHYLQKNYTDEYEYLDIGCAFKQNKGEALALWLAVLKLANMEG